MELTWITFPTIVVTVSLVAYYAAYLLKGNDLLVNKVDVVDIDQAAGLVRGNTWISLFSPQNRDYTIRAIPLPLDRDAAAAATGLRRRAGRGRRPGTEVVMSWFSVPEDQFGAMGSSEPPVQLRRQRLCLSARRGSRVAGRRPHSDLEHQVHHGALVRTGRAAGRLRPAAGGDRPPGRDRHQPPGRSAGRRDPGLRQAGLSPGNARTRGHGPRRAGQRPQPLGLPEGRSSSNYLSDQPWNRDDFKIDRADLMLAVMFHDSESTLTSERVLANDPLHDLDLTGQLALQRPMLVARIKRTGARLVLDNAPSPPKIDQLTLVRIILPLSRAEHRRRNPRNRPQDRPRRPDDRNA